jgi:hypothetical protein
MKDSEMKDYEWVNPLNEYLHKISIVTEVYEHDLRKRRS